MDTQHAFGRVATLLEAHLSAGSVYPVPGATEPAEALRRSAERGAKAVRQRCVPQWEAVRRALAHRDTLGWRHSCAESSGSSVGASNS